MNSLRPNSERAKALIIIIVILIGLNLISIYNNSRQLDFLNKINSGNINLEEANSIDTLQTILSVASVVLYLTSVVLFIRWFRRAYYNLEQMADGLTYSNAESAYTWFIPILNLFRPYQIAKELFKVSKMILENHGKESAQKLANYVLGIWWFIWIVNNLIANSVLRQSFKAESIAELTNLSETSLLSEVVDIVLCLVTIYFIRTYSSVEPDLEEIQNNKSEDEIDVNRHLVD